MRVAVDIGGTFTDVVVFDEDAGTIELAKTPTTPGDLAQGIVNGLDGGAVDLASVGLLIHGSTVVVNALIERKGARTALLTTQGFRDTYEIGRINRPDSFNLRFRKHRPLVPRQQIFEVDERIMADGTELRPIDRTWATGMARRLREQGYQAAAVVLLHSYREPRHESELADIIREVAPEIFVSSSHELSREYREYERTSTTVANAYVGPIVSRYLDEIAGRLADGGFQGGLMLMESNGGLQDIETARRQCIRMMESGPAGGVVGTSWLCERLALDNAIAFDMGGTTAKATVVQLGQPSLSPNFFVGGYDEGLAIRIPVLDIVEIGTGGGSIAWIDDDGGLHVGPRSAGAVPGPVAYGRGGTQPTITDANVVLGRLSAERFLGGAMPLDAQGPRDALREVIGERLGVSVERAALGILEIATSAMADAVRTVTIEQGLDPRDFTLVAYGGGGPLHATSVARELGIGKVLVPIAPGHFSALGMMLADPRRDFVQTLLVRLRDLTPVDLEKEFALVEAQGVRELAESGIGGVDLVFERSADMRYVGQEHAVAVPMPRGIDEIIDVGELKQRFDAAHESRYSHSAPEEAAEVVSLRVSVIAKTTKPDLPRIATGTGKPGVDALLPTREIWLSTTGPVTAMVYRRDRLLAGDRIAGPAVIEETASSTVLGPGDELAVDDYGILHIRIGSELA